MNRKQLEHVIRAGGVISNSRNLVIIGSQALLGSYPDAPLDMMASMEADIYPMDDPEKADLIDGSIGELSPFHETFGYYAHGVGPKTAVLPANWKKRLLRLEAGETLGWCLSAVDLAISKLWAGREKDIEFVRCMLRHGFVTEADVQSVSGELNQEDKNSVLNNLRLCL